QAGGDDREAAVVLVGVAGSAEEALGRVEGNRVNTTGKGTARRRHRKVIGAGEAGDAVEKDDNVAATLDQALGPLERHFRDMRVVLDGLVEGRCDDFALDRPLHISYFF